MTIDEIIKLAREEAGIILSHELITKIYEAMSALAEARANETGQAQSAVPND